VSSYSPFQIYSHRPGIENPDSLTLAGPWINAQIQINQPARCNIFTSLLLDVYVSLNMLREPPRSSSGACNCINSLWFYRWSVVVAVLSQRSKVKPEAVNAVASSWWWAWRRPKHVERNI